MSVLYIRLAGTRQAAWQKFCGCRRQSKKDPHIRICGPGPERVAAAKHKIMAVLQPKADDRVTLKMDMSFTEHSHVIGRGSRSF